MDAARVFVWRVRLCLLALAWGLVGVGADRPAPAPQSIQRSPPSPTVEKVAAFSAKGVSVVGSGPVSRSLSEPMKRARSRTVAPRPLDLRCSGRATKSPDSLLVARKPARAQKSNGCNLKSAVPGPRKPAASFTTKKRDTSIGAMRNAESPKARHKVARKGDARPADNA